MVTKIKLFENLPCKVCTSPSQGGKIYELIYPLLQQGEQVELDFTLMKGEWVFLSTALGGLLRDFNREQLDELLIFNCDAAQLQLIFEVFANAETYYKYRKVSTPQSTTTHTDGIIEAEFLHP